MSHDDPCAFCEIVAGRAPATAVAPIYEGRDLIRVWAIRPLDPVVPGHVLLIPETHVEDARTRPKITGATFEAAAWYARDHPRPFNLITSAGREATQTVMHLHVHYVPRAEGDGLRLPWGLAQ